MSGLKPARHDCHQGDYVIRRRGALADIGSHGIGNAGEDGADMLEGHASCVENLFS